MRLDLYLKQKLGVQSRNKAYEYIKSHNVSIDGVIISKPSFNIENQEVKLLENDFFVSRAGYKLNYFINNIDINLDNSIVLDIGASKGGFSQVLLQHNISKIVCVDVGSCQLDESIKSDNRVVCLENTDIRDFKSDYLFDLIVCDVSFISLDKIINHIHLLDFKQIILLFKPQFEVGTNASRNKKGVVTDKRAIKQARDKFLDIVNTYGWRLIKSEVSKKEGKSGSLEEFFYFDKR